MFCVARRLRIGSAIPFGCALAALWGAPVCAEGDTMLFTADTLELTGDARVVLVDGERSWLEGGYGKLRSSGAGDDFQARPEIGNLNLIWQPQFSWSLSATVVGSVQGGARSEGGLSQAYLSFRPMRGSSDLAFSARAGLMWPPVSLEHEGADWHVKDSITPSAINSWIGEEVKPVAIEGTAVATFGEHKLRATAAVLAANDTSGTLLTFRGWALHDRTTLAFRRQPLPPLDGELEEYQAPYTHPLLDVHSGFAHRPGYYAKIAWQPPIPIRLEFFRYDNRADPEDVNADLEWGWRTAFDNLSLVSDLGGRTQLKAQVIEGRTRMGYLEPTRRWVDNRFRSAFVMLVRRFGSARISLRAEAFDTGNRGSLVDSEYDETGWSGMIAAHHELGPFTGFVELLHVSSRREDIEAVGLKPCQRQTQLQAQLRMHW
ncbi:hypothetical protein GCM10022276_22410 [Sphingomonas limnosediminicola]|uniref:Uncharacterized protein n=1 Tax=Sphingomonas limnosediminicola TaxID=940133 RepID=A0ABP7LL74_9SPHN